jgi:hypothetical protein
VAIFKQSTVEELEWREELTCTAWPPVQQESGGGEGLGPIFSWHGGMGEESTNCLIQRAEHALSAPILCRGVGARHVQRNVVFVKEIMGGVVVKLAAVVCLEGKDGEVEVCVAARA